jgi:hypothetical protein
MAKRGPKPIQIDWEQFDKLCYIQCSLLEIAAFFECSEDTIENKVKQTHGIKFSDYSKQKRGKGKISLRRKQFDQAMHGNTTLLIWLGKQYLEQSDKQESKIEQQQTGEVKIVWQSAETQIPVESFYDQEIKK